MKLTSESSSHALPNEWLQSLPDWRCLESSNYLVNIKIFLYFFPLIGRVCIVTQTHGVFASTSGEITGQSASRIFHKNLRFTCWESMRVLESHPEHVFFSFVQLEYSCIFHCKAVLDCCVRCSNEVDIQS